MTYEEKRRKERAEERHRINTYAPLEKLEEIATHHFPDLLAVGRVTHGLDTMDSDELDFFEVSVWGLKEALIEAYLSGRKDAEKNLQKQIYKISLKAQGITPPLMVGDKVYQTDGVRVYESTISKVIYETKEGLTFDQDALDGKRVHRSREDVEKAAEEAKQ